MVILKIMKKMKLGSWSHVGVVLGLSIFVLNFVPLKAYALVATPIRYEVSAVPGQVLQESLNLKNDAPEAQTFYPNYYNFEKNKDTNNFNFVKAKDNSVGTWLRSMSGIKVLPGGNKIIIFSISVPKEVMPGEYVGAILYGTNPNSKIDESDAAIESRTGPIVILDIKKDTRISVETSITRNISLGEKGADVLTIQNFLINKGFFTGKASNSFDQKTKLALVAFQKANNLEANGKVDSSTLKTINGLMIGDAQPVKKDFALNGVNCHDRDKYFVINKNQTESVGEDILVKYSTSIVCKLVFEGLTKLVFYNLLF